MLQARKAVHVLAGTSTPCYFNIKEGEIVELETVVSLITNMGFPIACVVALFWYLNKERDEHKAETQRLADAINNNTVVMEKILTKMGGADD